MWGLKPKKGDNGVVEFDYKNGVFKEICRRAEYTQKGDSLAQELSLTNREILKVSFYLSKFNVCDNYRVYLCNDCGLITQVNYTENISKCKKCKNYINFSEVRMPYACKLLIQELESMSIAPRLVTN